MKTHSSSLPIVIIGGGPAGYFAAITCAEKSKNRPVLIIEQGQQVLAKVKISGGGRCNVTHACFDPKTLVGYYPRGGRELLGPFHHFQPRDTAAWFEQRGVALKTEADGRMFPTTDSSQTIIDTLQNAARVNGVQTRINTEITAVAQEDGGYRIMIGKDEAIHASKVLFATGSGRRALAWVAKLGHTVIEPIPSLFTFHIPDKRLRGLEGISLPKAEVTIQGSKLKSSGPVLITHHGLSGPAILKLSAWGAREFHSAAYHVEITLNWIGWKAENVEKGLRDLKLEFARKLVFSLPSFGTPRRLWERLLTSVEIPETQIWADLSREQMERITGALTSGKYMVRGQNAFKDEFVTCGGIKLSEVNFKTMESNICPGLYFAGEVLDIDAVTGGFNFQNTWTTGWIAGNALAK